MSKIILIGLLMISTTACNTVQGIGRDIERSGEALQRIGK